MYRRVTRAFDVHLAVMEDLLRACGTLPPRLDNDVLRTRPKLLWEGHSRAPALHKALIDAAHGPAIPRHALPSAWERVVGIPGRVARVRRRPVPVHDAPLARDALWQRVAHLLALPAEPVDRDMLLVRRRQVPPPWVRLVHRAAVPIPPSLTRQMRDAHQLSARALHKAVFPQRSAAARVHVAQEELEEAVMVGVDEGLGVEEVALRVRGEGDVGEVGAVRREVGAAVLGVAAHAVVVAEREGRVRGLVRRPQPARGGRRHRGRAARVQAVRAEVGIRERGQMRQVVVVGRHQADLARPGDEAVRTRASAEREQDGEQRARAQRRRRYWRHGVAATEAGRRASLERGGTGLSRAAGVARARGTGQSMASGGAPVPRRAQSAGGRGACIRAALFASGVAREATPDCREGRQGDKAGLSGKAGPGGARGRDAARVRHKV